MSHPASSTSPATLGTRSTGGDFALFERIAAHGDERAREALIERYLPLARSVALRYQHSWESFDDLLQVASLGLVKAVDGFDPERGSAFSSYAMPTILGEVKRHFRDRTWSVRVPRELQELSLRVDRSIAQLSETLQRQPSIPEIAAAVRASEEQILDALQAGSAHRALSFDARRGESEDTTTLAECIGVDEGGFGRAEARATVDALLAVLGSRERAVLRMRFEEDLTQAEIGTVIGVSQMQVSRILRRALARMHTIAAKRAPGVLLGAVD